MQRPTVQRTHDPGKGYVTRDREGDRDAEIEDADQTYRSTWSQYNDTGPTSPFFIFLLRLPGIWLDSHQSINLHDSTVNTADGLLFFMYCLLCL